jgi:hypothetical protein
MAWPNPRFTNKANGTVRDNLTGLIWLKDANCGIFFEGDATGYNSRNWNKALVAANRLKDGYCGLTDGSVAGNWHLPNLKELHSLIHLGFINPALPNTAGNGQWTEGNPFSGVLSDYYYWSSTTRAVYTDVAWIVLFGYGGVGDSGKTSEHQVWPVRGPQ